MGWAELLHWIAFYQWEADQALPPDKRPIRPTTREEAVAGLFRLFRIQKPKPTRGQ